MMRKLTVLLLFAFSINLNAQTTFWSDSFDAPSGGASNNNAGAGWLGSTFTPGGGQNTSFFGISNSWIIGSNAGACSSGNKLYVRSLGAGNSYLSDVFSDILNASPAISTTGYSSISLNFNWRCDGVPGQDYGQVGLSNDNGSTWNWLPTQYSGQETCINATIPISSTYEGISTFKIAFRFISNSTSCSTCDPPFNIDNITLIGTASAACTPPTVSAGSNVSICSGTSTAIGGAPTATGGSESGAFVYSWTPTTALNNASSANPTASPTITTIYTVSVHRGTPSCAATSQVTVTVNNPQALTITPVGSTSICQASSVTLNATAGFTNYTWTTPSGTQTGSSINASAAGAYSVSATGSNGCPSSSSVTTITINTPQALTITPVGSTTICQGSSVTLNASPGFTNYTWTTPSGTQTGSSINASAAGAYSVSATGSNGCPSSSSVTTITINTPQALTITPVGSTTICQGSSVTLNASPGFTNYSWTTPSGVQTSASISASAAGAYSVSATGSNSCISTSSIVNVVVNAALLFSTIPVGNVSTCSGTPLMITATPGFTSYSWSTPSGPQTGGAINASVTGAYTVTAIGSNGCPSTAAVVNLTVNNPITLTTTPSGAASICAGNPATLTAAPGFTSYIWSTPSGNQSGTSISASVAGSYSVSAIGSNNCPSTSAAIVVSINTPQPLSITSVGSTTICQGSSVTLNAIAGFTNYTWSTPSGTQTGASINVSTAGTYSVTATGSNNCPSTSSITTITVNTSQALSITPVGSTTICEGSSVILNATAGFTNYSWTSPSGMQTGSSVSASAAGAYSVTALGSNGCNSTSSPTAIAVNSPLQLSATSGGSTSICAGNSIIITATAGFTAYSWITPSGTQTGSSVNASTAGSYSVSAIGSNNCPSTSAAVVVSVNTPQPLSITPSGSTTICQGSSVTLNATAGFTGYLWTTPSGTQIGASASAEAAGAYSVTATGSNGCVSISGILSVNENTPQTLITSPSGNASICSGNSLAISAANGFTSYVWTTPTGAQSGNTINASAAGAYIVSATDANGCYSTSTALNLTIDAAPEVSITPTGPISICPDTPITLTAETGFSEYIWSNNQSGSTLTITTGGDYFVTATASNGCSSTSELVLISVFDEPELITVTPSGPITICQGQSITLLAEGNYTSYLWSNNDTSAATEVSSSGSYIINALNADGCPASSNSINVNVSEPFSISVSPSGDIILCNGESVTLQAQSGLNNYSWSNLQAGSMLSVSSLGGYSVSATNSAGCVGTSSVVNVSTLESPAATFTYNQISNYVIEFTNTSTGLGNSFWNFGAGATSSELNPSYNFPFDGSWPVSLVVSNECGFDTLNSNITVVKTGINSADSPNLHVILDENGISINSKLLKSEQCLIQLIDLSGKVVFNHELLLSAASITAIPKPIVASGIYMLQIQLNGETITLRVILK